MRDVPIIFSAPMVKGLLDGRKTMTRRFAWRLADVGDNHTRTPTPWQKVEPGDRLWVRESLQRFNRTPPTAQHVASLTGVVAPPGVERHPNGAALWKWKKRTIPSIHMPRWASRLTLVVTEKKIERLKEISEADAIAEGVQERGPRDFYVGDNDAQGTDAIVCFSALWWLVHGIGAWDENPEVVALTFKVYSGNIDSLKEEAAA